MIKKLYIIDLSKKFTSGNDLQGDVLVVANTKKEALEIAQSSMTNTRLKLTHIQEVDLERCRVIGF